MPLGVVGAAVPFVGSWSPSAKARAAGAPVRIDISRLQDGEMLGPIPAWRGRPIFVIKRSEEILSALNEDPGRLTDPDSEQLEQPGYAQNETRSRTPDVMVLVGLCPHLFCSPTPHIELKPEPFDTSGVVVSSVLVTGRVSIWQDVFTVAHLLLETWKFHLTPSRETTSS